MNKRYGVENLEDGPFNFMGLGIMQRVISQRVDGVQVVKELAAGSFLAKSTLS